MHQGVEGTQNCDDNTTNFVQIDVLIQRKEVTTTNLPQQGDAASKHQNQNEGTVEIQRLAYIILRNQKIINCHIK